MQKKVMALAVAGAFAAPAAALAQNVQIGGSIHLQYFNHDSGSTLSKKTDVLTTSEPEIYIRGEEKLGGGLSTWFQCTSSFDVLGQGLGAWCGRNSAIGMKGNFGNLFFGTWDTPHKLVTNMARGWWGGTNTLQGGSLVVLTGGSDSNVGNATGSNTFFRRHRRLISYHSPNFNGFTINAGISAGNEATALAEASTLKPRLLSLGGQYRTGPLFAGVGYEKHDDFNPGSPAGFGIIATGAYIGGNDTSFNVAAGYTFFGSLKVSGLYMKNEWEIGDGLGTTVESDGFALYVDWTLQGPHSVKFQYAARGDFEGTNTAPAPNTGVKVMGAAYAYNFSKRTQGYVAINQMKNDTNWNASFGTISEGATSAGSKQRVIGVGLKHSF